ncbi:hypothetical protein [Cognatiluteimonas weifangensis]|uniref:hypothetical protein n=1 Tax=Cognatiluteimonas weifangensis TaxID=2303539 RepID=UPI0011C15AF8|nr:hypothetical protein [Luteimonas weifangensis]
MSCLRPAFAVACLALAACTGVAAHGDSGRSEPMIADGTDFGMRPGDTVTLADRSTLRYLRLVNDSRCPPDVQCIWAGNAEIAFAWHDAAGARATFSLHTTVGDKQHRLGTRMLTLRSLARGDAPQAQLHIDIAP